MFNEANRWGRGGGSKRFESRIRGFDTLKAEGKKPREVEPTSTGLVAEVEGVRHGEASPRRERGRRVWQSKQGRTRERDGVDRLHYVRDRAKLLGV